MTTEKRPELINEIETNIELTYGLIDRVISHIWRNYPIIVLQSKHVRRLSPLFQY